MGRAGRGKGEGGARGEGPESVTSGAESKGGGRGSVRRTVGVNISGTVRVGRVRGVAGGEKEEEGGGVWTRHVPKGKVGGGGGGKGKAQQAQSTNCKRILFSTIAPFHL